MDRLDGLYVDHFDGDIRELLIHRGSIGELAEADAIDYLLISSRSKDYDPVQGGWVRELHDAGVSVELLEREPAMDLRPSFPCWISKDIFTGPGHYFKRLVVFEPLDPVESAAKDVWIVFQALRLFAGEGAGVDRDIRVAVPVLSSLTGEADFSVMLRMIFFAAVSLASRNRCRAINILVTADRSDQAAEEFASLKDSYFSPPIRPESLKALLASIEAQYPARTRGTADAREFGLTERQLFAIKNYTYDTYFYVNRALRRDDVTDPEFIYFQSFVEALGSGLASLPNYSSAARVERGFNTFPGAEEIYKVSSVVREAAYTSTTLNETPLWRDYILYLAGQIGKHVEALAVYPWEREVLFDSGMFHLVSRIEEVEQTSGAAQVYILVTSDEALANTSNIHFAHL